MPAGTRKQGTIWQCGWEQAAPAAGHNLGVELGAYQQAGVHVRCTRQKAGDPPEGEPPAGGGGDRQALAEVKLALRPAAIQQVPCTTVGNHMREVVVYLRLIRWKCDPLAALCGCSHGACQGVVPDAHDAAGELC
jgi:hypothetical protein